MGTKSFLPFIHPPLLFCVSESPRAEVERPRLPSRHFIRLSWGHPEEFPDQPLLDDSGRTTRSTHPHGNADNPGEQSKEIHKHGEMYLNFYSRSPEIS